MRGGIGSARLGCLKVGSWLSLFTLDFTLSRTLDFTFVNEHYSSRAGYARVSGRRSFTVAMLGLHNGPVAEDSDGARG